MIVGGDLCFQPLLIFLTETPFHFSTATGFEIILVLGTLAGGAVAAVLGLLVGLPTLRLRGDYLAIATLGFGEILTVIFQNLTYNGKATPRGIDGDEPHVSCVTSGRRICPTASGMWPWWRRCRNTWDDTTQYLVGAFPVFAVALLTIFVVHNIKYATSGRALLALSARMAWRVGGGGRRAHDALQSRGLCDRGGLPGRLGRGDWCRITNR